MPLPYWMANRGGLPSKLRRRANGIRVAELRRDLPPAFAWLPDEAVPEAWTAWALLRRGYSLRHVTELLELPDSITDELVAALPVEPTPTGLRRLVRHDRGYRVGGTNRSSESPAVTGGNDSNGGTSPVDGTEDAGAPQ